MQYIPYLWESHIVSTTQYLQYREERLYKPMPSHNKQNSFLSCGVRNKDVVLWNHHWLITVFWYCWKSSALIRIYPPFLWNVRLITKLFDPGKMNELCCWIISTKGTINWLMLMLKVSDICVHTVQQYSVFVWLELRAVSPEVCFYAGVKVRRHHAYCEMLIILFVLCQFWEQKYQWLQQLFRYLLLVYLLSVCLITLNACSCSV